MIQCNVQYVKKISKISWCELISLNHKIDCCICSSGSRAFPAGFVQQNLPRLNFVGSSHFFNFTYFFFPEEDNFPLSGKLCDVSNFQLRLHQREFKMVVPPSKVSNFFQRKEISQKLEAFFHSVSSSHRPFIFWKYLEYLKCLKFPLKKGDFEWVRRQGGLLKPKVNRSSTGFPGESFKITMGQNMQKSSKCHPRQQSFKLSSMELWFWLEEER